MASNSTLFSLLFITLLLQAYTSSSYDYYTFAVEWAGSVCATESCEPQYYEGVNPKFFNIHGLWPSTYSGEGPQYCDGPTFDPSALSEATTNAMLADWSGLYSSADSFHSHEWEKHGTCWNNPNPQSSNPIEDFFATVIQIANQLNIYNALDQQGLAPSSYNTFTTAQFQDAVQQVFGVSSFSINCESGDGSSTGWGDESDDEYFNGFYICLDLDYNVINCPSGSDSEDTCGSSALAFPPITF